MPGPDDFKARETADPTGSAPPAIVDFHNHYVSPSWRLTNLAAMPPQARAAWEKINARLTSADALIASLDGAGIAARVINMPTAFIEDANGNVPPGTIARINDQLAELVARHPGRLHGLATIDAFSGDEGAREVERAVRDLKLRGIFVEAGKHDILLGAPQTRPALAAAAALGVPVFVHPLTDPQLHKRFSQTGSLGARLARATINSAALVSLIETGTFDKLPKLQVVVTMLAMGGVMLAGGFGDGNRIRGDAPALTRRHIYIDTMGLNPVTMRAAIDMLGADHVLMGTDWPIVEEKDIPARLARAFDHCGLDAAARQMIAGGNALRLLGLA